MAFSLFQDDHRSFDILGDGECLWLLQSMKLGRLGVTIGALPAIFPVNYAMYAGDIYFRTDRGTKLAAALRKAAVAFQIDSFDDRHHHGWAVQAVGIAEVVPEEQAKELTDVVFVEPWAPGPHEQLVRIRPEFLSGRRVGFTHRTSRPWEPDVDT
jgi:uncharacterized protein